MPQLADRFAKFAAKVAFVGAGLWYIATHIIADSLPAFVHRHTWPIALFIGLLIFTLDGVVFYPYFRNPLRKLPTIEQHGRAEGKIVYETPRGKTPLEWINRFPDADMIHIRGAFNISRVILVSPRALRDVLNTNTYDFEKPWGMRAFLARVIGFGLILSEGAAHKKQRKALTPAFHIRKIRDLYGLMWDKTNILLEELQKDIDKHPAGDGAGYVEMSEWASRLTLDVIGPTAMGRDFKSLTTEDNPIAEAFLEILEPSRERLAFLGCYFIIPPPIMRLLPWSINRMLDRNQKFLRGLCHNIIDDKKFELLKEKTVDDTSYDILKTIMRTGEFTDSELVDQMLTFLAAGHETTASALTWCCWLLAYRPAIQNKLREELRQHIPSSNSPVTWDVMESLPYLNGVCEETQRLFPTVPATVREAVRDTTVAGTTIPKDTLVMIVPYAVNRSKHAWGADADEMVPERWIETGPDGTQRPNKNGGAPSNFSEITFLHGARACIGRDFAKAELRCVIAGVVGKFKIEMQDPDEQLTIAGVITTKPVEGMKLKLTPIAGW